MSNCNCEKQDGYANCCRLKKALFDLNQAIYESDKRASERDRAEQERDQLRAGILEKDNPQPI